MKLRLSWSFLNLWQQGKIDDALLGYFHVPRPTPPQYVNGRIWDEYCTKYINNHAKLPPEWGHDKLIMPKAQLRIKTSYNALSDLVGVLDLYDVGILYELKSGHSYSARSYAGTMQVPLYLLLAKLSKVLVKKAVVIRYNPKTDKQDRAIIYPTAKVIARAENYIDSLLPDVHKFFVDNDLFNQKTVDKLIKKYANRNL